MTPYLSLASIVGLGAMTLAMALAVKVRGKIGPAWTLVAMVLGIWFQYRQLAPVGGGRFLPAWVLLVLTGAYEYALLQWAMRTKGRRRAWWIIPLGLAPLFLARCAPWVLGDVQWGFIGLPFVMLRFLDVLWSVTDGALKRVGLRDYLVYVFFFPTVLAGPVDRFRRFTPDWKRTRDAKEFWRDLDIGVGYLFRGFLYKYVLAILFNEWLTHCLATRHDLVGEVEYAYVYTLGFFFDFAGYSSLAMGVSRFFGVQTPDNFCQPFAAVDIRDFWGRWHISLSKWFRDHIFTRFLVMAKRRKWVRRRGSAMTLGYMVTFGLMGLWHGFAPWFLLYGLYHGALMAGHAVLLPARGAPQPMSWGRAWLGRILVFHFCCLGMWIFSGHGFMVSGSGGDF